MTDGLPSGAARNNRGSNLAAQEPHQFHVVCSRVASPDRLETAVAGPFDGNLDQAKAHVRVVAESIAKRFGVPAVCDLTDQQGAPVYSYSVTGGAA